MSGRIRFLAVRMWVETNLYDAEVALHNGDPTPRRKLSCSQALGARSPNADHFSSSCRCMTWSTRLPTPPGLSTPRIGRR